MKEKLRKRLWILWRSLKVKVTPTAISRPKRLDLGLNSTVGLQPLRLKLNDFEDAPRLADERTLTQEGLAKIFRGFKLDTRTSSALMASFRR